MKMSLGERKARKYAALAERYRLEAEVKSEASDGYVIWSVAIREPGLLGDYLTSAWRVLDVDGRAATTRLLPGILIRGAAVRRKSVIRVKNEADFARKLAMYSYREDSPANVLRRIDFANEDGRDQLLRPAEVEIAETLVGEGYLVRDGERYAIAPEVDRSYGTYRLPKN